MRQTLPTNGQALLFFINGLNNEAQTRTWTPNPIGAFHIWNCWIQACLFDSGLDPSQGGACFPGLLLMWLTKMADNSWEQQIGYTSGDERAERGCDVTHMWVGPISLEHLTTFQHIFIQALSLIQSQTPILTWFWTRARSEHHFLSPFLVSVPLGGHNRFQLMAFTSMPYN